MMEIDLTPSQAILIKSILEKFLPENTSVYVFGSRAKGSARQYSDLDLAFDCQGTKMSSSIIVKIDYDFEHSDLPFKVDIIDLNNISESFKGNISDSLLDFFHT